MFTSFAAHIRARERDAERAEKRRIFFILTYRELSTHRGSCGFVSISQFNELVYRNRLNPNCSRSGLFVAVVVVVSVVVVVVVLQVDRLANVDRTICFRLQ